MIIARTRDFTQRDLALAIRAIAITTMSGVAVWICPKTGQIVLLDAGTPFAQSMMDASCGRRDGIVGAYVGRYSATASMGAILEDIVAHDRGLRWMVAA
jgi:hypothetical protein